METINNLLNIRNKKIYQNDEWFKFSIDSILLSNCVEIKNTNEIILDLCTGNAVIPLYLSSKYENKIYGIELQECIYNLGMKSININNISNITLYNDDIKNIKNYFKHESIDVITCNPPYFKNIETNKFNDNKIKALARHELSLNLDELFKVVSFVMKNTGTFYLIHRVERLLEISNLLLNYSLSIKELTIVYPKQNKEAILVLMKIKKLAKNEIKVLPPIIIQNEDNTYTEQLNKMFGGNL